MEKRRDLKTFFIGAFGIPFILSIFLVLAKNKGLNYEIYPVVFMLCPAFGVILEAYKTKDKNIIPNRFFKFYLGVTSLLILMALALPFVSTTIEISNTIFLASNVIIMLGSLIGIFLLVKEKKEIKDLFNLRNHNIKGLIIYSLLFTLLFFLIKIGFLSLSKEGMDILRGLLSFNTLKLLLLLFINIPLSYLIFFGEEYGWRYYLTPIMQDKYGSQKGIIIASLIWGIWHLPLNLFYYSKSGSQIPSFVLQVFVCISFGIFFTYGYAKTKNIWVPIIMHFINNNFSLLFMTGTDGFKNQELDLKTAFIIGFVYLMVFGFPNLTKTLKDIKLSLVKNHTFNNDKVESLEN